MYFAHRIPVHPDIRYRFIKDFPEAARNPAIMRLVEHIAFAPAAEDTGQVIVPYPLLAHIEGKSKQAKSHNYQAMPILQQYVGIFDGASFTAYDYATGVARAVEAAGLPDYLAPADPRQEGNVFFSDGLSASKAGLEREARRLKNEVAAVLPHAFSETQAVVSAFIDARKTRYTIVEDTLPDARRICASLAPDAQKHANRLLNSIAHEPVPMLGPVASSARAYEVSPKYQQLGKACRHALFPGYYEFDLTSAQTAIAATIWNALEVQEFLRTGGSIWTAIAQSYGMPLNDQLKKAIKPALYATFYGASRQTVTGILTDKGALNGRPFFRTPQVAALIRARNAYRDLLFRDGITKIGGRPFDVRKLGAGRVMALEAQHYEQVLLNPAIRLGMRSGTVEPLYTIVAYTFDGFIAKLPNDRSSECVIQQAQNAVQEVADKLGIYTRLEACELGSDTTQ